MKYMYVFGNISISSPQNENYFRQNYTDIQNAHRAVYDKMRKYIYIYIYIYIIIIIIIEDIPMC